VKDWTTKEFRFEKGLYFCFKCSRTFELYFLMEQYGYLYLICSKCGKKGYVNCFEDEYFLRLYDQYENMHRSFRQIDPDNPIKIQFNKDFEETCDPCNCGGTYVLKAKVKCPHCSSTNIEEIRIKKHFEYIDMVPNWVTHEKMNNEGS